MKVINITEEGRFGGPSKRIIEVAKGLKEYGIKTIAVFPEEDSEKFQNLAKKNDVAFHTLSMHRLTKDPTHLIKYVIFFFYEIFKLARTFKKLKPDVIHCNGSWQIKGVIAAKLTRIPSVWHMNDTFAPRPVRMVFSLVANFFSHTFVSASHRTAAYYFPERKKEITILPAPIRTDQFSPEAVTAHPEILTFDGIKVVTVGNVNPVKGYDTLIEAAKLVNEQFSGPIHFIAVGPLLENQSTFIAKLKEKHKKYKLDNFHFWGGSNEVKEILKAGDIYVCSSDFESSPISIWEAMAMAKPIVATNVGDVATIFKDYNCGLVVPTMNPELLAEKIVELANNQDKFETLGAAARATAINYFDIKICVKKHAEIYKSIVAK